MEGVSEDAWTCSWGHCCWEEQGTEPSPPLLRSGLWKWQGCTDLLLLLCFLLPFPLLVSRAAIRESTIWVASGQTFISHSS